MNDVAITRCDTYSPPLVYEAVKTSVARLGGMSCFVKPGQTVLLKPNLLFSSSPQEAIVTHPYVVGAVARLVGDCGGKMIIADSPGGPLARFRLQRAYGKAGLDAVATDTGASLNFDLKISEISNPGGDLIKRFELLHVAAMADVVINLPKLKNHEFMRLTGATKNIFGLVPGLTKAGYHAKLVTADNFARMLLDLLFLVKPALTVMDAVVGMEGDGPAAGKPRKIGVIMASRNTLALDAAGAYITGARAEDIPVQKLALARGIPGADIREVEILGALLDSVRVKDFRPPKGAGFATDRLPAPIRHYLGNSLIVPTEIRKKDCNGCQECYRMCPVKAITMNDKKALINKNMCIRCYCCHEICPSRAIDLKPSLLGRLLTRLQR